MEFHIDGWLSKIVIGFAMWGFFDVLRMMYHLGKSFH